MGVVVRNRVVLNLRPHHLSAYWYLAGALKGFAKKIIFHPPRAPRSPAVPRAIGQSLAGPHILFAASHSSWFHSAKRVEYSSRGFPNSVLYTNNIVFTSHTNFLCLINLSKNYNVKLKITTKSFVTTKKVHYSQNWYGRYSPVSFAPTTPLVGILHIYFFHMHFCYKKVIWGNCLRVNERNSFMNYIPNSVPNMDHFLWEQGSPGTFSL